MHRNSVKTDQDHRTGDSQTRWCFREEVVASDRDAVRSITKSTGFFREHEVAVAVELVDERLNRGTASGYYFVFAESDGEAIGYACFGPTACTLGSFDLYWIAVRPEFQCQGLGRLLLNQVERKIGAAGGQRIYVDTSGQFKYEPTRRFYEHNGFHCEARLADFYAPGDDRLIYAKFVTAINT
ncbi:MAG TPA: GNAT family N-acetyltransferase [Lacipirellulaceae bacterium]|nr:GNAT family N-acetyltransferase [Lacipirellulaceae bacterium]